jgi:hypothetical protein
MKISLAILALLNMVAIRDVNAINIGTVEKAKLMTEETRYIGADGKPINLAQTEGHLKLDLTRIRKYSEPISIKFTKPRPIEAANIQLDSCSNPS